MGRNKDQCQVLSPPYACDLGGLSIAGPAGLAGGAARDLIFDRYMAGRGEWRDPERIQPLRKDEAWAHRSDLPDFRLLADG